MHSKSKSPTSQDSKPHSMHMHSNDCKTILSVRRLRSRVHVCVREHVVHAVCTLI